MNPNSKTSSRSGFNLVELLVIVCIIAILAALLMPRLAKAKKTAQRISCVNNLEQNTLTFQMWADDNHKKYPMEVAVAKGGTREFDTGADTFRHFQVISSESSTPIILVCPSDTRTAAADFVRLNNQNISYFVGLDANEAEPNSFLVGDRNITADNPPLNGILKLVPGQRAGWTKAMHVNQGNIGLVDGSAVQCSDSALQTALQYSCSPTNTWRISLPE